MKWTIDGSEFKANRGDITAQDTEAIVNAANKQLAPGGGVAGAIHRAAGRRLTDHCKDLGTCETGQAVLTPGFELEADYIIHTVGPVYDQHPDPPSALRGSYENSLALAAEEAISSVSFPLLSTGAFGYPVGEASEIAVESIRDFLTSRDTVDEVRMILWGEDDHQTFLDAGKSLLGDPDD